MIRPDDTIDIERSTALWLAKIEEALQRNFAGEQTAVVFPDGGFFYTVPEPLTAAERLYDIAYRERDAGVQTLLNLFKDELAQYGWAFLSSLEAEALEIIPFLDRVPRYMAVPHEQRPFSALYHLYRHAVAVCSIQRVRNFVPSEPWNTDISVDSVEHIFRSLEKTYGLEANRAINVSFPGAV